MENNGSVQTPEATNAGHGVKVLIVQIDRRHVFVHDVTNDPFPGNPIRRCSNFYRRQKRFANGHFRFDVREVTAPPAREESA
jgi:hypothetical protein